jgi:hypothetical protein
MVDGNGYTYYGVTKQNSTLKSGRNEIFRFYIFCYNRIKKEKRQGIRIQLDLILVYVI